MRKEIESKIVEAIKERMGDKAEVVLTEICKNNDTKLKAIIIREPGKSITPTIYIDNLVDKIFDEEETVERAAEYVINTYEDNKEPEGIMDVIGGLNKEVILSHVEYQLINKEKNSEKLKSVHHKEYLDLAAIYRYMVNETESGAAYMTITSDLMQRLEITEEELEEAARKNHESKQYIIRNMASVIAELTGMTEDMAGPTLPMYVLSNEKNFNGATVMLSTKYFSELAEKLEEDIFILPSSIHEVIAVPTSTMDPEELRDMVSDINATQVANEEVLSDTVYRYSREDDEITIA